MKTLTHLVSIRESAAKSLEGGVEESHFAKLAQKTLTHHDTKNLAGATQIMALAHQLVDSDNLAVLESLNAETLKKPSGEVIGHLVIIQDTGYFLGVISASKPDIAIVDDKITMTNAFTETLGQIISRYKVKHLYSANFDRLVRIGSVAASIKNSLHVSKCTLHIEGREIKVWDSMGDYEYTSLAQMSQWDVTASIKRLTNGAHALLENNRWPLSEIALPAAGYKFTSPDDKTIIADESKQDLVKDLILWASDKTLSYEAIAKLLHDKHAYVSAVSSHRNGHTSILESKNPASVVRNLLRIGLPIYLSGQYGYSAWVPYFINDSSSLRANSAQTITSHRRSDIGVPCEAVNFILKFDHSTLTKSQWATRAQIIKAITRVVQDSAQDGAKIQESLRLVGEQAVYDSIPNKKVYTRPTSSYNMSDRRPLLGLPSWQGDYGTRYTLRGEKTRTYTIVDDAKQIIGTMRAEVLHKTLADTIIEALDSTGVNWATPKPKEKKQNNISTKELTKECTALTDMLTTLQGELDYARKNKLTETVQVTLRDLEAVRQKYKVAAERLAYAQTVTSSDFDILESSKVNVSKFIATFAALEKTTTRAPSTLNESLKSIVDSLTFTVNNETISATVHTKLATNTGTITLGPIYFTIPNVSYTTNSRATRVTDVVDLIFRDNLSVEEATLKVGYVNVYHTRRIVRARLEALNIFKNSTKLSAILSCPIAEAKSVIYQAIRAAETKTTFTVPQGIDPAYAAHILSVYTSSESSSMYWQADHYKVKKIFKSLTETKEVITHKVILNECNKNATNDKDTRALFSLGFKYRGKGKNRRGHPLLTKTGTMHKEVFTTVKCPYCKTPTVTHFMLVPELPSTVLCTTCRRSPDMPTVIFPEAYLKH